MINKEKIKTLLTTTLLAAFILSIAFVFTQCNDDDEEQTDTLAGKYTMQEVKVVQDYTISGQVILPAGTDVTQVSADGILSAAPCDDPANGAVELKSNGQLYLICVGESNELAAGTWTENSSLTQITLNLSSDVFPTALALTVNDITRTSNTISGVINSLILPAESIEDLLPAGVEAPPAVILMVNIVFAKVE